MNLKQTIFITFIITCFWSCSKDKDNFRPTISITSPTHQQNISGTDTLQIIAEFKDDQNLESLQVFLKDENNNVVLSSISKNPNTKTYQLNEWFFFDDIHLPSGQYYFTFKASDGENTTIETVDIWYDEQSKQRLGVFIADNTGSNTNITLLDNAYNASFYNNYSGDFLKMTVNSFEQQLLISSNSSKTVMAANLLTGGNVAWTDVSNFNITGFLATEDFNYAGLYDGNLKRYNTNGAFNFHGTANLNFYIEEIGTHNNYLITEQKNISNSNVQLVLSWLSTGAQVSQTAINEDILKMYSIDANTLALFTNDAVPAGNLIFYYFSTGLTNSPFNINTGEIDDCEEISTGIYLLAENGNLTTINVVSFSKAPYLNGVNANLIKYDYFTNELFVVDGNQLTIYDYTSKSVKGNYTHSAPILDLDFWYNK